MLNPGLVIQGDNARIACPDGRGINITRTTQGLQLYMKAEGCRDGKQHLLLITPHAAAKPGSMHCTICQCDSEQYTGQGLVPSKAEIGFIGTLKAVGLDEQTIWQVAVWWWKDRKAQIDACIYTIRLYLQVDGTKHTSTYKGKKAPSSITIDVDCCAAAWDAGVKLMRVHHADMGDSECLLDAVATARQQQCIVLSPGFSTVKWRKADGMYQSYSEYLKSRLPECGLSYSPYGNIIYTRMQL